jgi:hypothetical protein
VAIAFVAGNTASDNTGVATTGSLGTTVAGQLIVITISDDSAGATSVTSVTDSFGNTYTKVPIAAGTNSVLLNSSSTQMWYAVLAVGKAGASHTVTVNWSTAATGRVTVAAQYFNGFTGTPTLDQKLGATGTSTTASPGTTGTLTTANELVVVGAGHASTTSAFTAGAGMTNLSTQNVANAAVGQVSKVVAATTAVTGTLTIAASRAWGAIIATFYDGATNTTVTPGVLALTLTTFAPVVSAPRLVTPGVLALTLTTFAPAVTIGTLVTPPVLTLTLTTFAPTVTTTANQLVTPPVLALVLTTFAPVVSAPRLVTPGVAALILTTLVPTVTATINQLVTPGVAALILTRYAPTVTVNRQITPGVATLTLTTYAGYTFIARKPPTAYSRITKPLTPYDRTVKPRTPYSRISKPLTAYTGSPDRADGVTADSLTVTADSTTVYANGYLTSDVPDRVVHFRTQYDTVAKPRTAYQ